MGFLGNKTGLLPLLYLRCGHLSPGTQLVDLFTGTGSVAAHFARKGLSVHANDQLPLAANWARARLLLTAPPNYGALGLGNRFDSDTYEATIAHLAALPPVHGWVTQTYTPESEEVSGTARKYFTVENGMRIDAIRNEINSWRGQVDDAEWALVMATLLDAVSRVSNIAGTYGSYLKEWKPRSLQPLDLRVLNYDLSPGQGHHVTCEDAQAVAEETEAEVAYADPPYTKRQYENSSPRFE